MYAYVYIYINYYRVERKLRQWPYWVMKVVNRIKLDGHEESLKNLCSQEPYFLRSVKLNLRGSDGTKTRRVRMSTSLYL